MAGRIDRNDGALARAAVDGDHHAFSTLFERHLTAVFEGAWDVVRDRWLAAEVACEAFEVVWQHRGHLPTDDVAAVLVDVARRAAHDRLAATSPAGGPDVDHDAGVPGGSPTIGPVLHSRIVASLRARGVPVSPGDAGAPSHMRRRRRRLGLPVGATALLAVALGVGFVSLTEGDGRGDTVDTDGTQPPSTADEDDGELTAATRPTSSTSTTTTAPPEEVTTTSTTESPEDDAPPGGQGAGPSTTAAPPTSPPQPTTPPSTAPPPPPEPVIVTFDGAMTGRTCNGGLPEIALWWDTENGESARLRPRGGDSMGVPTDGAHLACAEPGTEWILRVENSVGSATDETTVN